jgi:(p)ppGpp synthase/HD superfamily hydrolase
MKPDHDEEMEQKYEGSIPDAIIFSFNAHQGQYRKGEPYQYIIHPLRVSEFLLKNFSHRKDIETLRAAAILHDTIEDTWATEEKLRNVFGGKITDLVLELTVPEQEDKEKKSKDYLEQFKSSSDEAKIIKLADIFDNVAVSMRHAEKWSNYLLESKRMVETINLNENDSVFDKIKKELLIVINNKIKSAKDEKQ